MPGIVRLTDLAGPCPACPSPTPCITASTNTFANGLGVTRVTDQAAPHCGHGRVASDGSPNVYCNNLKVCRLGDPVLCPPSAAWITASTNVFVNG